MLIRQALCLLLSAGAVMAGEKIDAGAPPSPALHSTSKKAVTECVVLNRTHPNFQQELRKLPLEDCVLVVGSLQIPSDSSLRWMAMTSAGRETGKATWKDFSNTRLWFVGKKVDIPDVQLMEWTLKVRLHGVQRLTADISYGF